MRKALFLKVMMAAALVIAVNGTSIAGQYEDGTAANDRGDSETAIRLLRPLAEQGDARAQSALGLTYENLGDEGRAAKWYRLAADQGDVAGQLFLGILYQVGRGVPQDYAEAAKWLRAPAEHYGIPQAQVRLGLFYATGQGVPQDHVQAHMWFNLAAARFLPSEKEFRDRAIRYRNLVSARMTAAQIAEAQRLARQWTPTTLDLWRELREGTP
jgi:TPR repeat protein